MLKLLVSFRCKMDSLAQTGYVNRNENAFPRHTYAEFFGQIKLEHRAELLLVGEAAALVEKTARSKASLHLLRAAVDVAH